MTLVDDVDNGTLVLNADGSFTYTPEANFNGTDSFTYTVSDDGGTANGGDDTGNTVTVTINVAAVNDAPTDIIWNASPPASQTAVPGSGVTLANLASVDPDDVTGFTYLLLGGSSAGFAVSSSGAVTTTSAMAENATYTLNIQSTDSGGAPFSETFNIITGSGSDNTLPTGGVGDGGDDILYGTEGNDIIYGGSGNDTLFGQDDNDLLDGGTGADTMYGGANSDDYGVDDAGDVVVENAGGGDDDFVHSSITYALTANVEHLTLTYTASIDGTGNTLDNLMTGNSGNNTLSGQDGEDILMGGAGNDVLLGGADNDQLNGGSDDDTYVFGLADGDDVINDFGGSDAIVIDTDGAALSTLNAYDNSTATTNDDLVIEYGGQAINVNNHFDGTDENVETISFDGGSVYGYSLGSGSYTINFTRVGPKKSVERCAPRFCLTSSISSPRCCVGPKITART